MAARAPLPRRVSTASRSRTAPLRPLAPPRSRRGGLAATRLVDLDPRQRVDAHGGGGQHRRQAPDRRTGGAGPGNDRPVRRRPRRRRAAPGCASATRRALVPSVITASAPKIGHGGSDHSRFAAIRYRNTWPTSARYSPCRNAATVVAGASLSAARRRADQAWPASVSERQPGHHHQRRQHADGAGRVQPPDGQQPPRHQRADLRDARQPAGRAVDEQPGVHDRQQQRERPQRRCR